MNTFYVDQLTTSYSDLESDKHGIIVTIGDVLYKGLPNSRIVCDTVEQAKLWDTMLSMFNTKVWPHTRKVSGTLPNKPCKSAIAA